MFIETNNNMVHTTREESSHEHQHSGRADGSKKRSSRLVHTLITVFGLLGLTYIAYWGYQNFFSTTPNASIFSKTYSAVFLDTGEVYFGKVSNKESAFVKLDNAYYLRVTSTKDGKLPETPDLKLIKVGIEFHKPKSFVELQRSHILFIEELEADSAVVKVIEKDMNGGK